MKKIFIIGLLFFIGIVAFAQQPVNIKDLEEKSDVFYLKGAPYNGACFENFPSGKKGMEGNFVNGKRDGVWVWYYEAGTKKRETNYRNGKPNGESNIWYKNGQKRSQIIYDNGTNIKQYRWDEEGNFLPPAQFSGQ